MLLEKYRNNKSINIYPQKMEAPNLFLPIVLCIFLSCQNVKHKSPEDSIVKANSDNKTNMYEEIWKKDSCGCLKQRTAQMSDSIIINNKLVGKDTLMFMKHMGKYNKKYENNDGVVFIYYIKSTCINGSIDENADKSWISFKFSNDGILTKIPEAIAIE